MSSEQLTVFINDVGQAAALVSYYCDNHLFPPTDYRSR
jgi:hypothetical protein